MSYVPTDLHGHSLFSDARATPEAFIETRRANALEVVALSDHDIFAGVRRAEAAAKEAGLTLIPAMEVTSFFNFGTPEAEQVHVLAYFPRSFLDDGRLERTRLHQRGLVMLTRWREFVVAWLNGLAEDDRRAIDPDGAIASQPPESFPGLQMLIDVIVLTRRDLYGAFRRHHVRFWEDDRELFGWSPEELIETIRADGATDIIAHPARYKDKARLAEVQAYASGWEAFTSRHKAEVAARFRDQAESAGKLWSASTDDHQQRAYVPPTSGTPRATLDRLLSGR